jgi:hypothetical protein
LYAILQLIQDRVSQSVSQSVNQLNSLILQGVKIMSSNVVAYLIVPTIAGGIALVPVAKEQLAVLFPQSIEPTTHTVTLPSLNSTIISKVSSNSFSFNFPKQSCGDVKTGNETAWYPVFIDNGEIKTIRSYYCNDAISTIRKDTGNSTVQLASFSDRDKAVAFANRVGGVSGDFSSNSSISSSEEEASIPVESKLSLDHNLAKIQTQEQPSRSQSIYPPNINSCAFDLSANSNCLEQLSKYQQYVSDSIKQQAQESEQNPQHISQFNSSGGSTEKYQNSMRSMQNQINVDNFINNQRRSIDNQNFLIQQRNAERCATTNSLFC